MVRIRRSMVATMASSWVERRATTAGTSYRVKFRVGGRESSPRYAGAFRTMREARIRRDWVAGELAAMRVPDLDALQEPVLAPTIAEAAKRWQESRVDVAEATRVQHRSSLHSLIPLI